MEITRNDKTAKVSFPGAAPEELNSVTFESPYDTVKFVFGSEPPQEAPEGTRHINYDSGIMKVREEELWVAKGTGFNNLTGALNVPYPFVTYAGKFDVRWEYTNNDGFRNTYTEIQQHTVVQPLFSPKDIQNFDPDFLQLEDSAIIRLERVIRGLIERITGQKFELTYGVQMVNSYNGTSLMLPKRSVALDDFVGVVEQVRTRVESDGWIIRAVNPHSGVTQFAANPIYDVYAGGGFKEDRYFLKGEWGYRTVPEHIQLAAMLLAQDYGCNQSVWRDRYIEMMKNVDWSIQYNDRAFEGTGNVKVDQILQSYTVSRWGVV